MCCNKIKILRYLLSRARSKMVLESVTKVHHIYIFCAILVYICYFSIKTLGRHATAHHVNVHQALQKQSKSNSRKEWKAIMDVIILPALGFGHSRQFQSPGTREILKSSLMHITSCCSLLFFTLLARVTFILKVFLCYDYL